MKNTIYDYVEWRGELNSYEYPFHEVDYLVLSQLAYVHLDGIKELSYQQTYTLQELFSIYTDRNKTLLESQLKPILNESHYLFEKMAQSLRYQNIRIISYINDLDKDLIKQFSAMCFILEDETMCIAYRGTDDNLIGWHEDFLMLCEDVIEAQISSVEFLSDVAQYPYQPSLRQSIKNKHLAPSLWQRMKKHFQYKKTRPIILTGHSKGGNLAMYASCFVKKEIQERIHHIFNFDGPGFQNHIIQSPEYKKMLPYIHSYLPHYSFFGIVLGHEENYQVVHSHYIGMLQHNSFSWEVTSKGFIADELSYESVEFAIKVIVFLEKLSYEDKRTFVDAMFGIFYKLGLQTFSDLSQISYKHIINGIKELTLLDPPVRKTMLEVLHMLWLESKKTKKE